MRLTGDVPARGETGHVDAVFDHSDPGGGRDTPQFLTVPDAADDMPEGCLQNIPFERSDLASSEAGIPAFCRRGHRGAKTLHRFRFDVVPVVDDSRRGPPASGGGFAITNHMNAVEVDQIVRLRAGETVDGRAHFRGCVIEDRAGASVPTRPGRSFAGP